MSDTPGKLQINPMSAVKHYAASADFWEDRAKLLQGQLDDALHNMHKLTERLAALEISKEGQQ